jgi:predicted nuclease of predicted toxin-antitoxin system
MRILMDDDVLWAAAEMKSWPDPNLLEVAEEQGRILFTLDKDFKQIAEQRRTPLRWSGVVLFRIHPTFVEVLRPFVRELIASSVDLRGHVTVVTQRAVDRIPL